MIVAAHALRAQAASAVIAAQAFESAFRAVRPIEIAFDKTNPEAERWARERSSQLIVEIDDTTRDAIREIVGRAFKDGIPPKQAAKLIKPMVGLTERDATAVLNARGELSTADVGSVVKYGGRRYRVPKGTFTVTPDGKKVHHPPPSFVEKVAKDYSDRLLTRRSQLIARTETIAASNEGQRQLWTQAQANGQLPTDALRVWITTDDDRLCPTCSGMEGQIRSLGQPFDAGISGEVMGPPAHPGCRCATGISSKTGTEQTRSEILAQTSGAYPAFHPEAYETLNRFQRGGAFTAARQKLHDAIVEDHFVGKKPVKKPVVTVLGGGPAAGKSTLTRTLKLPKNSVHIDVDQVRTMLPEYREGLVQKRSDISSITHEESSLIAKRMAREAASGKYHMLMDGTGDSSYESIKNKLEGYRAGGAKIVGQYVTVDTEEAIKRMNERGRKTGRFVPEEFVREVHKSISSVLPRVMNDGLFDEVELWDTTQSPPIKVASAVGKDVTIHNEGLWRSFLAKAHR